MADTRSQKRLDLILLLVRIPFLLYFAYEVFAKDEVSQLGYLSAAIGFSVAAVHHILRLQRGKHAKKEGGN